MEKLKNKRVSKLQNEFFGFAFGLLYNSCCFIFRSGLGWGHIIGFWMDEFCKVPGNKTSVIKHVLLLWGTD